MKNSFLKHFFVLAALGCCFNVNAQNEIDVLRYSSVMFGGTARYMGMSGAFGSVGADISVLSVNPAGIAKFTKSEFTITPGYVLANSDATYNQSSTGESRYGLTINNAGLVGAYNFTEDDLTLWKGVQFGIAYNRLASYHSDVVIKGDNYNNSLLDVMAQQSNGLDPNSLDDFGTYLAWSTWAISPYDTLNYNYYTELPGGNVEQTKTIYSKGSLGETVLTMGGNYNNKLLLGLTVGFPNVKYEEQSSHNETVLSDSIATLTKFNYRQNLQTSGIGINAKLGVIFIPIEWLRLGVAVHTPTRFSLSDNWSSSMDTYFKNGNRYSASSPAGNFKYFISTPARVIGSAAVIIAKKGMVSVDYEVVNYTDANLRSYDTGAESSYDFANENFTIHDIYQSTNNIRVGAEWRLSPFTVRAGYAYYGNPYKSSATTNAARNSFSLGAGYRENGFFLDMAYVLTKWNEDYYLYDPVLVNAAAIAKSQTQVVFTVGFRY